MRNIHVIPTDKQIKNVGDLVKDQYGDIHIFTKNDGKEYGKTTTKLNIYITSDEEIKEGDWYFDGTDLVHKKTKYNDSLVDGNKQAKKIILTTDKKLIDDGVQAIDDEFLEWFFKNPSCEFVEVQKWFDGLDFLEYKIIIPKEEPKQEWDINTCRYWDMEIGCEREKCICENQEPKPITDWLEANRNPEIDKQVEREADVLMQKQEKLEEAKKQQFKYDNLQDAKEISSRIKVVETLEEVAEKTRQESFICCSLSKSVDYVTVGEREKVAFIEGAKWQQEQDKNKYSEEEVLDITKQAYSMGRSNYTIKAFNEWFEQFKKK